MNTDMKNGANIALNSVNDRLETQIDEIHSKYMRCEDDLTKQRLDAQMQILWNVKSMVEDMIVECDSSEENGE